jgi:hypothetical protein
MELGGDDYAIERYDGINADRLTPYLDDWYEAAQYYDDEDITFNGSFDAGISIWNAVQKVCFVGRCEILRFGINYTILVDKSWTGDPVQLFSAANIVPDSFEINNLPVTDATGELDINFNDANLDYDMNPLSLYDTTIANSTKKLSIDGFGIIYASQAWKMLYYMLAKNRLIPYAISFKADIDAIVSKKGDQISVRPPWRNGGRIISCPNNNQIITDSILFDSGTDVVVVRVHDPETGADSIETHTVSSVENIKNQAGYYYRAIVTITDTWTKKPKPGDIFSFGPTSEAGKLFTVTGIEETGELQHKISVIPYDADRWAGDDLEPDIAENTVIVSQSSGSGRTSPTSIGQINDLIAEPSAASPYLLIPVPVNLNWVNNESISWEAEDGDDTIQFSIADTTYDITPGTTSDKFVYFDITSPTEFQTSNDINDCYGAGKWLICINDNSIAYPFYPHKPIHGATILPGTVTDNIITKNGETVTKNGNVVYKAQLAGV